MESTRPHLEYELLDSVAELAAEAGAGVEVEGRSGKFGCVIEGVYEP